MTEGIKSRISAIECQEFAEIRGKERNDATQAETSATGEGGVAQKTNQPFSV